ncbi:hypothetical protein [Streptomyces sp. ST2-7A]|uniref:hypothetical protein n=1 Tax=Streptomyces sp. ST2-7A TaxID=2907214 RepID=UPI001F3CF3B4|nr:hypothetical protein [Streptomyces sp. ST2-7A]MCE7081567.1 hypothetical protein [Streptomyces sp. ST2-7A]
MSPTDAAPTASTVPPAPPRGAPDRDPARPTAEVGPERAAAAIVEHYGRLVRLGYLVLPPALGRHRGVIVAHGITQAALPRGRVGRVAGAVPSPRSAAGAAPDDPAYAYARLRVLRAALDVGRPLLIAGREFPLLARLSPRRTGGAFPRVIGLRLLPRADGTAEPALERELGTAAPCTRAAFALRHLEGLSPEAARGLLEEAGVEGNIARAAVRAADALVGRALGEERDGADPDAPAGPREITPGALPLPDPCVLRAGPTDLLRRRRHTRTALVSAGVLALLAGLMAVQPDGGGSDRAPGAAAADPSLLVRAEAGAWERAGRLDFTSWPARGPAVRDRELLDRVLTAWTSPDSRVTISTTRGTDPGPPAGPPRLLYAGEVDGAVVVLMHDGLRLMRYAEAAGTAGGPAVLDLARTDGAQAAMASVVVLNRGGGTVRYLTAPWVSGALVRDLRETGDDGRPAVVDEHGATDALPTPAGDTECGAYPVLEFTTADPAGRGPYLLADLGELTPALLTTGGPEAGPEGAPDERARQVWASTACHLLTVAGSGVRTVGVWEFARQELPGGERSASWVCTRADTWRTAGSHTLVQFQPPRPTERSGGDGDTGDESGPATPGAVVARAEDGPECGPRSPHVLAGGLWQAPDGEWYLLAAGSEEVVRISAAGGVTGEVTGRTMILPAEPGVETELTARLEDGDGLRALGVG